MFPKSLNKYNYFIYTLVKSGPTSYLMHIIFFIIFADNVLRSRLKRGNPKENNNNISRREK